MNSPLSSDSQFTLDFEKVSKLGQVLEEPVLIHSSREDHPSVSVKPVDLVRAVEERILKQNDVFLHDVRLNGSAATWVVDNDVSTTFSTERKYNDIDLIFRVDIPAEQSFDSILHAALFGFLDAVKNSGTIVPGHGGADTPNPYKLQEAYVRKLARVWSSSDHWCLISFHNIRGLDLELKFVDRCHRPYEYSVDSFQVIIDSYLALKKVSPSNSPHLFPTVNVETMWGDVKEALRHVNERWIATRNPESIRGGGLLKYCKLLVLGYRPAYTDLRRMERYMCSRFFIDFATPALVEIQITKYLETHFRQVRSHFDTACLASAFLWSLFRVVELSSDCLAVADRRRVLHIILNQASALEQPFQISFPSFRPVRPVQGCSAKQICNRLEVARSPIIGGRCPAA
ncbi:terminal nucleotidyltransferase 5C-like [Sycon ciliatum]|uniref:terminal nucleotidyltransferase 5C-like n=1 Tax=Sycon ciliatum TaxID=27933 RepID=UPI0020AD5635|eukprot:scpid78601/ scgid14798/ Protein FAM46B